MTLLQRAKTKFTAVIEKRNLRTENIEIRASGLDPEQVIGNPERSDYPLLTGEEVMIQAEFREARGQAFTDHPGEFTGTLEEILSLPMENNFHRALLVAAVNAVLRSLDLIEKTVHCRDEEMEKCVQKMVDWVQTHRSGQDIFGIVGYQPALLEALSKTFGPERVRITDLHPDRAGTQKYGIEIWNGKTNSEKLILESDFLFITGSTLTNGTIDELLSTADKFSTDYCLYGNTISGTAYLLDLPQLCFFGR